jgi:glycosyltransferase involved in cell wall biosynthesis
MRRTGRSHPARPVNGSPLRVLWLIKGLDRGGAEGLLSLMARFADRDRFQYEVAYLLPRRRTLVEELRGLGLPVHCLYAGREWNLGWAVRLRALLRQRRYDVVHVHSPYVAGISRLVVRSLPPRSRPVLVTTEHSPWSGYVLPTRLLNALTYRLDDAHVAVSDAVRAGIPPSMNGRVHVIHHGIDLERIQGVGAAREELRRELGIGAREVVVGTVSNFRPEKRYVDLLKAARLLLDRGVVARFASVGHGPEELDIRSMRDRMRLADRFLLLGYREDATRVMAAFDVFVLASTFEGLSLALLEALALGLPVVATAVGGIPESIDHGVQGFLVPPRRPDRLADALEPLIVDPALRISMGSAAELRGRQFDIAIAARQVEALYGELAR